MFKSYFSEELNQDITSEHEQKTIDDIRDISELDLKKLIIDLKVKAAIDSKFKTSYAYGFTQKCILLRQAAIEKEKLDAQYAKTNKSATKPKPTFLNIIGYLLRSQAEWQQQSVFRDEYHKRGLGFFSTKD